MKRWILWTVLLHAARLSTALQILIFLPLTLVTLSKSAFLLLSLLLSLHALIHGSISLFWSSSTLSILQVPMHPFLLLVCFNAFSSSAHPWLTTASTVWGIALTYASPLFIALEGISSLLVAQKLGQEGKKLVDEGEVFQFALLISSATAYVISAWWIVSSYPDAASSPLSSTLLGVAVTALLFLTLIGFVRRSTNIIESSALALFLAYNVWSCGYDQSSSFSPVSSSVPVLPNILPHVQTLLNFVMNTLPKPVLVGLLYRLMILQFASRILPTIGSENWNTEDTTDDNWHDRSTSSLSHILLTYRQFIFVTVYSHLLMLDHVSQVWWRWINIFFTLLMWAIELLVSPDGDVVSKEWKID